jgi:hypothetical protein
MSSSKAGAIKRSVSQILLVVLMISLPFYTVFGAFSFHHMGLDFYSAKAGQVIPMLTVMLTFMLLWIGEEGVDGNPRKDAGFWLQTKKLAPIIVTVCAVIIVFQSIVKADEAARIESVIQRAELVVSSKNAADYLKVKKFKYLYFKNFKGMKWEEVRLLRDEVAGIADRNYPDGLAAN